MGKKITADKPDIAKSSEDTEDTTDNPADADVAELIECVSNQSIEAGNIDIAKIIKSTGGIQAAVSSAVPMIDGIGAQARLEAQRASAMAMKEYRRQLQGIVQSMQGTIREEGTRLADEICARIATQVRQAVLLETEKKALNLVDEFVLGWQIEAESMSQDLLVVDSKSDIELPLIKSSDKIAATLEPFAKEPTVSLESLAKITDSSEKDKAGLAAPVAEKAIISPTAAKKQPEMNERPKTEPSENEKKVVFDFATFIAQSKSPVKS